MIKHQTKKTVHYNLKEPKMNRNLIEAALGHNAYMLCFSDVDRIQKSASQEVQNFFKENLDYVTDINTKNVSELQIMIFCRILDQFFKENGANVSFYSIYNSTAYVNTWRISFVDYLFRNRHLL